MRRMLTMVLLTTVGMLIAVQASWAQLREKTTVEEFTAFLNKLGSPHKETRAVPDRPLGPGFVSEVDGVSLGFSENSNQGRTIDDVMVMAVKEYSSFCDNLQTHPIARHDGKIAVRRTSYTCKIFEEGYGELIVVSDGKRYHLFDFGSDLPNKSRTAGLGQKIYDGLLSYR